jgi:two-component system nitrogen regulation response regulator NtrX
LPLFIQAELLKAIEDQRFYPVGSNQPVTVDVRIIAATNSNLLQRIAQGTFRRDPYERLNVIAITIPPLRHRREDIEALIHKTLADWNRSYGEHKYLTEEAMQLLRRYTWPGNVRELLNAVRSTAAIAPQDKVPSIRHPKRATDGHPASSFGHPPRRRH